MRPPLSLSLLLLAATLAHADVAIPPASKKAPPAEPRSPLGPRCDRALLAAQKKFAEDTTGRHWNVAERRYDNTYRWSDMCGVYGEYSIELAPDHRPASPWHWTHPKPHEDGDPQATIIRAVRRENGWRATLLIDRNTQFASDEEFFNAFQPALDVCLTEAAPRSAPPR